jgi:hypothetical protein
MQVAIPEDEEFRKLLRETLDRPMEWYDVRVERAVKGKRGTKGGALRGSRNS